MNEGIAISKRVPHAALVAVWAHAVAVSGAALAFFVIGAVFSNILFYRLRAQFPNMQPKPQPRITDWYVHGCGWALLLPAAFVTAAFLLSRSSGFSPERVFAYSGISLAVIVFLISFAAVAVSVPYMTIIPDFSSPFWPK